MEYIRLIWCLSYSLSIYVVRERDTDASSQDVTASRGPVPGASPHHPIGAASQHQGPGLQPPDRAYARTTAWTPWLCVFCLWFSLSAAQGMNASSQAHVLPGECCTSDRLPLPHSHRSQFPVCLLNTPLGHTSICGFVRYSGQTLLVSLFDVYVFSPRRRTRPHLCQMLGFTCLIVRISDFVGRQLHPGLHLVGRHSTPCLFHFYQFVNLVFFGFSTSGRDKREGAESRFVFLFNLAVFSFVRNRPLQVEPTESRICHLGCFSSVI